MNKNKKIILVVCILVLLGVVFYVFTNTESESLPEVSPYVNSNIETQTFEVNSEWGYNILIDGNIYVHQPNIPAVSGGYGFKTEQDAQKVAELVVNKIRNNMLPPTVSVEELQSLGIE